VAVTQRGGRLRILTAAALLIAVQLALLGSSATATSAGTVSAASTMPVGLAHPGGHIFGVVPASHSGSHPTPAEFAGTSLATPGNLTYHNGPVMHTNQSFAIYWLSGGSTPSANYTSLTNRYFTDVARASGASSNVYATDTQYYDNTNGNITYGASFGGSYVDTAALPSSGCTDRYTSICLTDTQLQAEIKRVVSLQGWPVGPSSVFFLFTGKGVGSCIDGTGSTCSFSTYCAYHSNIGSGSSEILYANMPYADTVPAACDGGQHPNGDEADATVNLVSHEHNEAITDPLGNAWYDSAGNENGDKCAWNFGTALGSTGSGSYNQVINGNDYYLQQEWSNASSGCALTYGTSTSPPVNTAAPSISGTVQVGSQLSASTGTWSNSPTSYTYAWQSSASSSGPWSPISGATSSSYTPVSADQGRYLQVVVTASNAGGSASAASAAVGPVAAQSPPVNTALPVVSGTVQVGSALSASTGSWSNSPTSYAYVWQSSASASGPWSPISGATGSSYTPVAADQGRYLQVVVTASNGGGSASAASAAVGPVAAQPQSMTFSIGAGGDDGDVFVNDMTGSGGPPAPYPPTGSAQASNWSGVGVRRGGPLYGGYEVRVGLLRFDTSGLPDNATVTGATLNLYVTGATSADGRSLVGEWYDPANWPIDAADYTSGSATTALAGTAIGSLAVNQVDGFSLQNLGSVSLTGYTGLRLEVSGAQPTGDNGVYFASYENGSHPAAQLTITYTTP
jgi:hypothetical protein